MCLRRPRLAWLLGLMVLAGLAGCGPAPSDNAPRLEPRADPVTPVASPATLTYGRSLDAQVEARPAEILDEPDWLSTALMPPDVRVRLQALDRWEQEGPTASIDPLIAALDDEDEDVETKAMEILERDWDIEQD